VKEATLVPIDFIASIHILSEFADNAKLIKSNVESAVASFINTFKIGTDLEQSDIVDVVVTTPGVDRLKLPVDKFDRSVNSGVQDIIGIAAFEVVRPGSVNITII
jgi:hypothetical protein